MWINHKGYKRYIIWFWLFIGGSIVVFSSSIWLVSAGYFGTLPTFEELENPKNNLASEVYSSDGVVLGKYYFQNRVPYGYLLVPV